MAVRIGAWTIGGGGGGAWVETWGIIDVLQSLALSWDLPVKLLIVIDERNLKCSIFFEFQD